jgi:MFS family permease
MPLKCSIVSVISVLMTSGMGPIFQVVEASYDFNPKASDLMTYPTLFMGIGNLIAMPLAMAVGRQPVFVASAFILVIGSIWCAASRSLGSHIAGRDIMSLAAGQSEALCPLIIQVRGNLFLFIHGNSHFPFSKSISCMRGVQSLLGSRPCNPLELPPWSSPLAIWWQIWVGDGDMEYSALLAVLFSLHRSSSSQSRSTTALRMLSKERCTSTTNRAALILEFKQPSTIGLNLIL